MALTKITPQMFDTSAAGHDFNIDNGTFVVDASANRVGIGTATPTTKFHIFDGGTDTGLRIQSAASADNTSSITFDSRLADNSNKQATITAYRGNLSFSGDSGYGKVGIGTTTPSTLLHVNGISTFAGNILPSADSTHDIGTSANRFANAYFDTMYGTVGTAAQTNITSVGTLTGLTTSGDITVEKSSADSLIDVLGDGANDAILNLRSNQNTISTEGFQIWYDNNVGDVHLHTTYTSSDAAIRFHTRTGANKATNNERLTILGDGNVGIGNTSPSSYYSTFDNLVIGTTGANGITIVSSTNQVGTVGFADGTSGNEAYRGFLQYDHTGDDFYIGTAGSTRVFIDETGNVGIGETSLSNYLSPDLVVVAKNQNGGITVKSSNTSHAGTLAFADATAGTAAYDGYVQYEHNNRALTFGTATTEAMRIDSNHNVGIGVTPEATWQSGWDILRIGDRASFYSQANSTAGMAENAYYAGAWKTIDTAASSIYQQDSGNHHFYTQASASAGSTVTAGERFTIRNDGKVGIGWPGTSAWLGILKSGSSAPGMNITDGSTSDFQVYAGYSTGIARVGPSAGGLVLQAANSEAMYIDTSRHVRFGNTGVPAVSAWAHSTYGNTEVNINGGGGYGILHIQGDGAGSTNRIYSIGVGDGILYLGYDVTRGAHNIKINSNGTIETLGNLKPAAGKGIDFSNHTSTSVSGTSIASAQVFDDYEEGTWTPFFFGSSTGTGVPLGSTQQKGSYIKIGNLVHLSFYVGVNNNNNSASGNIRLGGIPYPATNSHGINKAIVTGSMMVDNLSLASGRSWVVPYMQHAATSIAFYQSGHSVGWNETAMDTSFTVIGEVTYRVD